MGLDRLQKWPGKPLAAVGTCTMFLSFPARILVTVPTEPPRLLFFMFSLYCPSHFCVPLSLFRAVAAVEGSSDVDTYVPVCTASHCTTHYSYA